MPADAGALAAPQGSARAPPARRACIPRATYRVQLNASFGLRDASAIVPYLAALGVSHVYCSPYFRARPGSVHGYDVVDHNHINPEIGTAQDLDRFVELLRAHGMGHVLDIVPNHVGIMGSDNAWWLDVLENGQASAYAQYFDIDWQSDDPALNGKVLIPILGDHYGHVLERGELVLRFERDTGSFAIFHHEHRLPVDPRDYPLILKRALEIAGSERLGEEDGADFASLIDAFGHLPHRDADAPAAREERQRDKEVHKRRLVRICGRNAAVPEAIGAAVQALNGTAGDAASFDELHRLLESQAYRLAYWRVASDEINYRRFFDVNDLAALRMENEAVFEATHRLAFELVAAGKLDGLRIDHPDGLYDPVQYFRRLQQRAAVMVAAAAPGSSADAGTGERPLYLVVEKITASFEHLPEDWPVHGTTGYRFVNVVTGLTIDGSAKARLDRGYRAFTELTASWPDVAYESKRLILSSSLAAELNVLATGLARIARAERNTRDFTENTLKQALIEVIACFPVYRTYIAAQVSGEDRRYIDWAIANARRRGAGIDGAVYDFVRAVLLGEATAALAHVAPLARAFAMKFQQVTAPVTAKGVEDTALYRFNRLVSLNEVGGEPDAFGTSVRAFHADAQYRLRHWPHELLASSTHDTKRSEDVRARINVLSEIPGEWRRALERWRRMNRSRKREVDNQPAPSANDEYLLYQTLLGSLPLEALPEGAPTDWTEEYRKRIEAYLLKAVREAKLHTSWANPNAAYEEALRQFITGLLEPRAGNLFLADLLQLARPIAHVGLLNGLSHTLCKLTAPGVPDTYQGSELWDFSLVDPDNRRAVDYQRRRELLESLNGWESAAPAARNARLQGMLERSHDGLPKLFLIWRVLQYRRAHEALFAEGDYLPLRVLGSHAAHVCAFARRLGEERLLVIAPRLYHRLLQGAMRQPLGAQVWADTRIELPAELAATAYRSCLDGTAVRADGTDGRHALALATVLAQFPVALLSGVAAEVRKS